LILSLTFKPLLPLAITSLLCSFGVGAASALQARVPPGDRRWWSRPLIGILYCLQPIVRGWARYRGRFLPRTLDLSTQTSLDSVALQQGRKELREAAYATAEYIDRPALIADLMRRLEERGWQHKPDLGWSEYDVEVYGTRWADVQLLSAVENPSRTCRIVKFRLNPRWSIQARTAFWSLCAADLVIIGLFAGMRPWTWLLLLTLPLFAWFVSRKARTLQSLMRVFLDKFAETRGYTRVPESEEPARPEPSAPPPRSVFSAPESEAAAGGSEPAARPGSHTESPHPHP
jgi:hypothetical protein